MPNLEPMLAPELGLDARIRQVEQRLIERERAFKDGAELFTRQVRHTLQPRRVLNSMLGVALAVGVLGWLAWRWRRHHFNAGAAHVAKGSESSASPGWVRLAALGWPMLPAHWRANISPASAGVLAGLGLPLLEALLRGPRIAPPTTMPTVDLARFAGRWFVAARLPHARAPLRAQLHYLPRDDGRIDVWWVDDSDPPLRGLAQVEPGSGGAKLRLSFASPRLRALPWAWHEHWLLHVEPDYGAALVGSPRRDRLLLLSRAPLLSLDQRHAMLLQARERGYAVERLQIAAGG